MWIQFLLTNVHFGINLFVSLVFFSVGWLYFDAWSIKKRPTDLWKVIGFSFFSFAYLVHATYVESSGYFSAVQFADYIQTIYLACSTVGGLSIIVGLLNDPVLARPGQSQSNSFLLPVGLASSIMLAKAEAMLAITTLYYRRQTQGLEKHLSLVVIACLLFFFSDILEYLMFFRSSSNIWIYQFVAPFGPIWIVQHIILLIAAILLRSWVFTYLLKRVTTQLFLIGTTTLVFLCIVVTMLFSSLLFTQIEKSTLESLRSNASMLTYAIESLKSEALTDAQLVAQNPELIPLLSKTKFSELSSLITSVLYAKKQTDIIVVGKNAQVFARGGDIERIGDSVSDDPFVRKALEGVEFVGFDVVNGIISPQVSIVAAVPIRHNNEVIGAVEVINKIDTALLQGIKQTTGMTATIFGGSTVSATSLDISGYVGSTEQQNVVMETLLHKSSYTGKTRILNSQYYASYVRLLGANDEPVGMVSVGIPQRNVFSIAGTSIELTFACVIVLLLFTLFPLYKTAKGIEQQFSR